MTEIPNKTEDIRNPDGTFKVGNPGSPGRPKGKTLKEFAREMLMSMSDEEKVEYMSKLPRDIVWKMAEGNPAQDVTSDNKPISPLIVKFLDATKDNGDTSGV